MFLFPVTFLPKQIVRNCILKRLFKEDVKKFSTNLQPQAVESSTDPVLKTTESAGIFS